MADKAVSALTAASTLDGTETLHVVQGGNSRKGLVSQFMDWIDGRATRQFVKSAFGALAGIQIIEEELTLSSGATKDTTTALIPARSIVLAVLTRTTLAVTGATSYDVGVVGETNKFGGTLSIALNATNAGVIAPTPYYSSTAIRLTANGSNFTGGKVRVSLVVLTFGAATS